MGDLTIHPVVDVALDKQFVASDDNPTPMPIVEGGVVRLNADQSSPAAPAGLLRGTDQTVTRSYPSAISWTALLICQDRSRCFFSLRPKPLRRAEFQ